MAVGFNAERFNIFLDKAAGADARRRVFVREATRLRNEALSRNERILGRRPSYDTFVDGVKGAPLQKVNPDGVIVFRFHIAFGAAVFAVNVLRHVSPYDPTPDGKPHYRDRHFVIVDDAIIEPPYSGIVDFERMLITNDRIYSRVLESRYGVYRDLAYPVIRRELNRSFRVSYIFDDYFGERAPGILIRPRD